MSAENYEQRYRALERNEPALTESDRLHQLFALDWERTMEENPEFATYVGYPGFNDRWTDFSAEAVEKRKAEVQWPLSVLRKIDRAKLSHQEQLFYDLARRNLERAIEGFQFPAEMLPLNQLNGVQIDPVQLLDQMPKKNAADLRDILARLKGLPALIDQQIEWLKRGVASEVTAPKITLRDVPQQVLNLLPEDPAKSPLLAVFGELPADLSQEERERIRHEAADIFTKSVAPAYRKLHEYLVNEYIPAARETIGLSELPRGREWYAFQAAQSTTTKLSPQEIHDIGMREVNRIRGEMEKVLREVNFTGTPKEFAAAIRNDTKFQFQSPEALLSAYRDIAKRIDPELPRLFGKLPRLPYGVKPIPPSAEESAPAAYYWGGSPQAGRAGYFFANTSKLPTRVSWEMEALTLHEAVPGHHLQIALAQELEGVPEFRKHDSYTAYIEGWGLYAESLGSELGLYKDPYSRFGALSFEMWRACRLVVDTGMHSLGWTRQRAIDFMLENGGNSEHDTVVEVDRYIVWPGQALAYKIGQLKIRELRDKAKSELGERFDIRAFHDVVLGSGALPLDTLEQLVNDWIKSRRNAKG
jgi:uncharacterized protein (DUF885 family)